MTASNIAKMDTEQQAPMLPADPMVSMIERVVMDPSADLDKLERMLAMKERMDAEAARKAFGRAMAECQAKMEPVARNKRNDQTDSNYTDLAGIYKVCKPVAGEHGFSFSTFPAASEKPGYMAVRWVLRHSSGHEESDTAELPIDDKGIKGSVNKTGVHAFGSTATYARRYLFCMVFDIATQDDDGNAGGGAETVSEEQYRELRALLDESGMSEVKFNTAFGHKDPENADLHMFPASLFESAKARLIAYRDRKQGGSNV